MNEELDAEVRKIISDDNLILPKEIEERFDKLGLSKFDSRWNEVLLKDEWLKHV